MNQSDSHLAISAVVCTRNRGASVACSVQSILASDHPDFELIVIDQSTDDRTAEALTPFGGDARLRHVRSDSVGLGRARNLGLREARGEVVAFTDDDCEAPPTWLAAMERVFREHPEVVVAFCNVSAAPYDNTVGFIPAYHRDNDRLLRTIRDKCTARAIGAGIAVRRAAALELGGFDDLLGAGGVFPSCEDGDMAVRALLKGHQVYETAAVAVLHHGFRAYAEGRELSRRDWIGIGAAYAKPLRCGHWRFLPVPAYELLVVAFWPMVRDVLHLRRPGGAMRVAAFIEGFARGWRTPIDRKTLKFREG